MKHFNVEEKVLKTPRDYRGLGGEIDDLWLAIQDKKYGRYIIEKEERNLFLMIENMIHLQEKLNKGVRVLGGFESCIIEIYDYRKEDKKIEESLRNFNL